MSGIDDRRKSMEAKLHHDNELRFKVTARRNKLLGLWAAERMGLSGDDADIYAKSVVLADFEEVGDEDVIRKVTGDLEAKGIPCTAEDIRQELVRAMEAAKLEMLED